jgi:hypothetical protein
MFDADIGKATRWKKGSTARIRAVAQNFGSYPKRFALDSAK